MRKPKKAKDPVKVLLALAALIGALVLVSLTESSRPFNAYEHCTARAANVKDAADLCKRLVGP
jgi:hypothetical protein